MKHFTLLELSWDAESPMIGTINNIPNNQQGVDSFKNRFEEAVKKHFDVDEIKHGILPDLFAGSPYDDVLVEIDNYTYTIRILETWIY